MIPCLNWVCSVQAVADLFRSLQDFCLLLRESNSTLSRFQVVYIDLVTILLNLIRVFREGNWPLHLSSVQEMIPWCFAYNYSTILVIYLNLLSDVKFTTHSSRNPCKFNERWIFLSNWKQKHIW